MLPDELSVLSALHPIDASKVRGLGEALCDLSAGRRTRERPDPLVAELMVCARSDCSAEGFGGVLDRLLSVADYRLGAEEMAAAAFAEIMAARGRR